MTRSRSWTLALAMVAGASAHAGADPTDDQVVLDWNVTFLQVAPVPTYPGRWPWCTSRCSTP